MYSNQTIIGVGPKMPEMRSWILLYLHWEFVLLFPVFTAKNITQVSIPILLLKILHHTLSTVGMQGAREVHSRRLPLIRYNIASILFETLVLSCNNASFRKSGLQPRHTSRIYKSMKEIVIQRGPTNLNPFMTMMMMTKQSYFLT